MFLDLHYYIHIDSVRDEDSVKLIYQMNLLCSKSFKNVSCYDDIPPIKDCYKILDSRTVDLTVDVCCN